MANDTQLHPLPTYTELQEALSKAKSNFDAAQVHGLLCGILCGNPGVNKNWQELIQGPKPNKNLHELLQQLYKISAQQLGEFSFEFQLLLPDEDDQEIPQRTESLGLWCQGFLTGLKMSNIEIVDREPSEVTDALNDIIEIAQVSYEQTQTDEESEAAYLEIMEYVRLAVLMIYQELRETTHKERKNDKIH